MMSTKITTLVNNTLFNIKGMIPQKKKSKA
jgi:hypothetical protein